MVSVLPAVSTEAPAFIVRLLVTVPADRVAGKLPAAAIITSSVSLGMYPKSQFAAVFQSVLLEPSQVRVDVVNIHPGLSVSLFPSFLLVAAVISLVRTLLSCTSA